MCGLCLSHVCLGETHVCLGETHVCLGETIPVLYPYFSLLVFFSTLFFGSCLCFFKIPLARRGLFSNSSLLQFIGACIAHRTLLDASIILACGLRLAHVRAPILTRRRR